MNKRIKNALILIFVALTIGIVALLVTIRYAGINGYTIRVITSRSMEPTLIPKSTVVLKQCGIDEVKVGDIIGFYDVTINSDVVHRVVEIKSENGTICLVTKGDNNKVIDNNVVTNENFIGVMKSII